MEKLRANYPNIVDGLNQVHSIYPCTGYLTFGPWLYLVPQYKPENILMLGYGGGTTAGLIRMFYGDVPITAVDMLDCTEFNYYDVNLIQADAFEFVKNCNDKYDTVIVDLYREGSYCLESFVFDPLFVEKLKEIANYIIIHALESDSMEAYADIKKVRTLSLNVDSEYNPNFHYYAVNQINKLPVQ